MRHLVHEASDVGHCNARIDLVDPRLPGVPARSPASDRLAPASRGPHREERMLVLRPTISALLLASLLAGCSLYGYKYRLWEKPNASNEELDRDLPACAPEPRVGRGEGNPAPNTYFLPPLTADQTQANPLFQRGTSARRPRL